MRNPYMKLQDDISMPHTHTRTSRDQYVPHYFKVEGITTSNANSERINKLQKRAARTILEADSMEPSSEMFQKLGWMSVSSRLKYI